jgi:hypothetical protein
VSGNSLKTWSAGDILTASDINAHPVQQTWVVKSADESVTSTTTVQNDDHLVLPVLASTRYWLEAFLIYDGAVGGDIKLGWSFPSGATMRWYGGGMADSATVDNNAATNQFCSAINQTMPFGCFATANPDAVHIRGNLLVASTAGNMQLQWAQLTSSGTATKIYAESLLRLTRLVP